jgi:hypothetical protein
MAFMLRTERDNTMQEPQQEIRRFRLRDMVLWGLLMMTLLGLWVVLWGCYDIATWQARTFYGLDCRSDQLKNGQCVPVKKGGPDVTNVQP